LLVGPNLHVCPANRCLALHLLLLLNSLLELVLLAALNGPGGRPAGAGRRPVGRRRIEGELLELLLLGLLHL
jgi:hypothetical protein